MGHEHHGSKVDLARLALVLVAAALLALPIPLLAKGGVYSATRHADPVAGVLRDPNYARGECVHCHTPHGGAAPNPYNLFQAYTTVGEKNALCATGGCHAVSSGTWQGLAAYDSSAHGSVLSPANVYPGTNYAPASCMNCHDPHGVPDGSGAAPFAKHLRMWAWGTGTGKSDEEQLCYGGGTGCHAQANSIPDSYGIYPTGVNVSERFSYATPRATATSSGSDHLVNPRHDIGYDDQNTYNVGAKVECINCHNPHIAARTFQEGIRSWLAQPSDRTAAFTVRYRPTNTYAGRSYRTGATDLDPSFGQNLLDFVAFCLGCHDNTSTADWPAGVRPGNTPVRNHPLNMLEAYLAARGGDQHGNGDGTGSNNGVLCFPYQGSAPGQCPDSGGANPTDTRTTPVAALPCTDCHDPHGSRSLYHLKDTIRINGVTLTHTASPGMTVNVTVEQQWYSFCLTCHKWLGHPSQTPTSNCSGHHHGGGRY